MVPLLASKVTLQSRLKSPSSAFKKMVKGSKQRHELYDMLGLRVIITQRQVPSESYGYGLEGFPNADVDMYVCRLIIIQYEFSIISLMTTPF